jgi:hypothetical protein
MNTTGGRVTDIRATRAGAEVPLVEVRRAVEVALCDVCGAGTGRLLSEGDRGELLDLAGWVQRVFDRCLYGFKKAAA